ncbi:MAG: biotin/lipoyl-binding protein [Nitrospina sp.]|jgi:HlyD family secretion protein|nr:biotin/lipoyl-binding protein [Nitrospina sp.]MBT5653420.1 biotin/lipoyl-binding protein [Nitrospina sp.]MBT6249139.1 biotin/lipoyl-binding protein [Nitrospina sp.]
MPCLEGDYIRISFHRLNQSIFPLLVLVLFLFSCSPSEDKAEPVKKKDFALPVQVGKLVYIDVADEVRAVGNIQAEQRVVINSEVRGKITRIAVEEGMKVKAGDLLAQIDPREYELILERQRADLSSVQKEYKKAQKGLREEDKQRLEARMNANESALDFARLEFERTQKLVAEKVLSQSALDAANDKVRQAEEFLKASKAELAAGMKARSEDIEKLEAEMQAIRKQVAVAQLNLSKVNIRAPFEGVIIAKEIEQGAFAEAGTSVVRMIGSSRLKAVLEMPQSYRNKLKNLKGTQFLARELGMKFEYHRNLARLIRVIPDANIFSGNIKVQIDLPDPNPSLFPGLTLESTLNFGTRKNVPHVPSVSLVISEQGTVVYIVKDGKAHLVPVKAFKERNDFVEIEDFTHQLGPKADLILRGSGAVFPGVKVFLTNPESKLETPFNSAEKSAKKSPAKTPET